MCIRDRFDTSGFGTGNLLFHSFLVSAGQQAVIEKRVDLAVELPEMCIRDRFNALSAVISRYRDYARSSEQIKAYSGDSLLMRDIASLLDEAPDVYKRQGSLHRQW